jgi:hypothetical protein
MEQSYNSWRAGLATGRTIPHYYGDYVRPLFIAMAVLSFVVMPLGIDLLPFGIVTQVGASLILVLLAGLTTPRNLYIMLINATVAGVSVVLLESFAIMLRSAGSPQSFFAREAGVLIMLAALYFSVKTARNMLAGKLGHPDSPLEFDELDELVAETVPQDTRPKETFDPME